VDERLREMGIELTKIGFRMGNHGKNWSFIAGYLADWQRLGDFSLTKIPSGKHTKSY